MSFEIPAKAIPVSIYSTKAAFNTERDVDGTSPIATSYILRIKKSEDSTWTEYTFGSSARVVYIDDLEPHTIYDAQWKLVDGSDNYTSTTNSFTTGYPERLPIRPSLPTPLFGEDFPNALQAELDSHINYINTIDDERAIERFLKEGAGRIEGCNLSLVTSGVGQTLSVTDGWFQSGSGLGTDDLRWFPGVRVFRILTSTGAKDITPPEEILNSDGDYYGIVGAYIDEDGTPELEIEWVLADLEEPLPILTDGRWIIGRITIELGFISEVVTTGVTTTVPTLRSLQELIASLSLGGGGGGGGTDGPTDADKLKFNPSDTSIPAESTFKAVKRIEKSLRDYMDAKFQALQPGQETSLEYFVSQFARSCVSWGQNNPAGLLRIDGSFILPEQYGQTDIDLDLEGQVVPSPVFEGYGNLQYNDDDKLWEV